MPPRWRRLVVQDPPPTLVEPLFRILEDGGAPGAAYETIVPPFETCQRAGITPVPLQHEDQAPARQSTSARVIGYLPETTATPDQVTAIRERVAELGLPLEDSVIEETDWAEAWKRFFKPTRIGKRLLVCPSWERPNARPEDIVLELDPGQAFGTGDHPTTRMMLRLLERHIRPGGLVLDIGAGSGILAIAAAKLGARYVACCDIEHPSVHAANANFERNGVAHRTGVVLADGFGWIRAKADMILSNIISATLIRFAPAAASCLSPDGVWLLSGVILDNEAAVAQAVTAAGLTVFDRESEGPWISMAARR
jgi:ribosomal protein L11 methyltransferase